MAATQRRHGRQRQRCQPELISRVRAWSWYARGATSYRWDACNGGSHCPGPVAQRERAGWHDPVLGRWLGLTLERPALCLRGLPRRPRPALGRVRDLPGWVGFGEPRGWLGGAVTQTSHSNRPSPVGGRLSKKYRKCQYVRAPKRAKIADVS